MVLIFDFRFSVVLDSFDGVADRARCQNCDAGSGDDLPRDSATRLISVRVQHVERRVNARQWMVIRRLDRINFVWNHGVSAILHIIPCFDYIDHPESARARDKITPYPQEISN